MNNNTKKRISRLKREKYQMLELVRLAIAKEDLNVEYLSRPPYQQNDYLGWITSAEKMKTKLKRLNQMIEELKLGDKYMNIDYKPKNLY